jgi:hypothetical protein
MLEASTRDRLIEHGFIVAASSTDSSVLHPVAVNGAEWECAFEPDERDDWLRDDLLRLDPLLE